MIIKMNLNASSLPVLAVCDKRDGRVVATSFKRYNCDIIEFYDFSTNKTVRLTEAHFNAVYFIRQL